MKIIVKWPRLAPIPDPNYHYREWLETNVGKQGVDWDWALEGNDAAEDNVTIWFSKRKSKWASIAALQWA